MFTMTKIREIVEEKTKTESKEPVHKNYLDRYVSENNLVGDYYTEKGKVYGRWYGELSKKFGIYGNEYKVGDETAKMLWENKIPTTGEKMTQRNVEGAVKLFDFVCSADKTVSIMAVAMQDHRIADAHQECVGIAMRELEKFASCRVRQGAAAWTNDSKITGNICYAAFRHDASRAIDPQLHTHCSVMNVTYDEETGRYMALDTQDMCRAIRYAGKVYQNELAKKIKKLGYDIEKRIKAGRVIGFKIAGISEEVQRKYSQRREQLEVEIKKMEKEKKRLLTKKEVQFLVLKTRADKKEMDPGEALKIMLEQLSSEEIEKLSRIKENSYQKLDSPEESDYEFFKTAKKDIGYSVKKLFETKSVVQGHDLISEALNQSLGVHSLDAVKSEVMQNDSLVNLYNEERNILLSSEFATPGGLLEERECMDHVNMMKGRYVPLNAKYRAFNEASHQEDEKSLEDGGKGYDYSKQREVIGRVLNNKDMVVHIHGVAGAGKTTLLKELKKGIDSGAGCNVYFIAPTNSAVQTMRGSGLNAKTLMRFLNSCKSTEISKDSVIIMDEASLNSVKQGLELIKIAEKSNSRIVLVGDTRQHTSVEAGDFLRILKSYTKMETVKLDQIVRQKEKLYLEVVENLSKGKVKAAFETMKDNGWIIEADNYIETAVADYLKVTDNGKNMGEAICVCPTHQEKDLLTELFREKIKECGLISMEGAVKVRLFHSYDLVDEEKKIGNIEVGKALAFNMQIGPFRKNEVREVVEVLPNRTLVLDNGLLFDPKVYSKYVEIGEIREKEICIGDRIRIRGNDLSRGLYNGDLIVVDDIDAETGSIKGINQNGVRAAVESNFVRYDYGYATTSHSSQGMTVNNVIVAAENMDKKSAYVSISRGVKSVSLHTLEYKALLGRVMGKEGDRLSAVESESKEIERRKRKKQLIENIVDGNVNKGVEYRIFQENFISSERRRRDWVSRYIKNKEELMSTIERRKQLSTYAILSILAKLKDRGSKIIRKIRKGHEYNV